MGQTIFKPQKKINSLPTKNKSQHEKPAIEVIKQLGKKLTNLPEDKFNTTILKIEQLAKDTSLEDIIPLFNTSKKESWHKNSYSYNFKGSFDSRSVYFK